MSETTSRVLQLLGLLQARRVWSGADLAERLGVTGRSVRRDIERLRDLGYPVHASKGHGGGYRLHRRRPRAHGCDRRPARRARGRRPAAARRRRQLVASSAAEPTRGLVAPLPVGGRPRPSTHRLTLLLASENPMLSTVAQLTLRYRHGEVSADDVVAALYTPQEPQHHHRLAAQDGAAEQHCRRHRRAGGCRERVPATARGEFGGAWPPGSPH